jgi:hypothetical protein
LGGTSSQQQQVNQAKENFITAVLRQESGATIRDDEFAREDKKYFPQLNDSEAVLQQKTNARNLAIKAMIAQAGGGAKNIDEYKPSVSTGNAPTANSVTAPNGQTYNFSTREQATAFKKAAGIP